MAIIDDIFKQAQEQSQNQPQVQTPTQAPQSSWVSDLIANHQQPGTERLKRTPESFNFNREPFDPSSYYTQLKMLSGISKTATETSMQEAANRDAALRESASKQDAASAQSAVNGLNVNYAGKATGKSSSIISSGMQQLGKPYIFGDEGPGSFDCSGLMQFIFGKNGVKLPRTAAQQQQAATRVSNPVPGDLVFYGYPAHHVALYLGNGKMLAAPHSGANVRVQPVYGSPTYGRV